MSLQRRTVLTVLSLFLLAVAGLVLHRVLGTVFLAVTAAYVLVPAQRRLCDRGMHDWWAAAAVTTGATVAVLVLFAILVYLASIRLMPVLGFLAELPDALTLAGYGFTYTIDLATATAAASTTVRGFAIALAAAIPVLSLKVTLFAILVFALLVNHEAAEAAILAPIPREYHDVASALGNRATETLYAIYVLQAATAFGTFLVAIPVFVGLGYPIPLTLALAAGVLQFLPIVGPALLIAALSAWRLAIGDVTGGLVLVVVAGIFVAWLPDVLIRPRLSRVTARLPGSLYYIGFVGGLLTVGAIGVVAGPLAIALAVTAVELLADEERNNRTYTGTN